MRIQAIVRNLGLACLCCGLGLATVYAVEDDAANKQTETLKVTDDVTGEIHEVFADEEKVMPCDEHDEREACVAQRTEIRSRGVNVPPLIPFKLVNERFGRCLRPTSKDSGAEVKLYSCGNYSSRYWTPSNVFGAPDWTQLRNNWSGKCLKRSDEKLIQVNCMSGYVTREVIHQAHREHQYWEFNNPSFLNPFAGETVSDVSYDPSCLRAVSSTVVQVQYPCHHVQSDWRWRRNPI